MNPSTSRDSERTARTSSSGAHPCPPTAPAGRLGEPTRSTDRTREAKCGLVMSGTITATLPVRPGDQATGSPVRNEAELADCRFDPTTGLRRHLLGDIDGARHRGRVHAGAGGNVEDRRPTARAARRATLLGDLRHPEAGDESDGAAAAEHAARWPTHTHGRSPTTTAPRCPSSHTSDSGPSPGHTWPCTPTICFDVERRR